MKRQYINPHYLLSSLIGLLALIGIASCDDSDIVRKVEPKLDIEEELLVAPSVSRQVVKLHSTYPWFAEASDAWIKLYRYRGQALKPDSNSSVDRCGKKYGNQAYHCSEQCRKDVVHPIDKRRKRQDFDEGS